MDSRSEKNTETAEPATRPIDRARLRPWIAPTFERLSLKEATAGIRATFDVVGCS